MGTVEKATSKEKCFISTFNYQRKVKAPEDELELLRVLFLIVQSGLNTSTSDGVLATISC